MTLYGSPGGPYFLSNNFRLCALKAGVYGVFCSFFLGLRSVRPATKRPIHCTGRLTIANTVTTVSFFVIPTLIHIYKRGVILFRNL